MSILTLQIRAELKGVERENYDGPVADLSKEDQKTNRKDEAPFAMDPSASFHARPKTSSGGRNLQESSFAFSGE